MGICSNVSNEGIVQRSAGWQQCRKQALKLREPVNAHALIEIDVMNHGFDLQIDIGSVKRGCCL